MALYMVLILVLLAFFAGLGIGKLAEHSTGDRCRRDVNMITKFWGTETGRTGLKRLQRFLEFNYGEVGNR